MAFKTFQITYTFSYVTHHEHFSRSQLQYLLLNYLTLKDMLLFFKKHVSPHTHTSFYSVFFLSLPWPPFIFSLVPVIKPRALAHMKLHLKPSFVFFYSVCVCARARAHASVCTMAHMWRAEKILRVFSPSTV